jgi:putative ABC transport system permease protein
VDPGFKAENVMTLRLSLPEARYKSDELQVAFFDRLRHEVAALPGVVSVGGNVALPMTNSNWTGSFEVEGFHPPPKANGPWGDQRIVTPGYFQTMGIPLKGGRPVAIVDEVLARKYWPGQDALGKRVGFSNGDSTRWLEVVGVVGHVMQNSPKDDEHTQMYRPFNQQPFTQMGLAIRTRGEPAEILSSVRQLVNRIDPQQPLYDARPMEERLLGSAAQPRFLSLLLGLFAAVAATLAAVGLYGVMSYTVAQQTRELGIRLALGAEHATVLKLVLSKGLGMAGIGIAIGAAGALGLGRLMSTQLFQTRATDPVVFAGVAIGLVAVALGATWIPARRATRVDPITALRAE